MDERHEQFLIIVGQLCAAAALAAINVELRLASGAMISGAPASVRPAAGDDQVDDSGWAPTFRVDAHVVALADVVACTLRAPG